MIHKTLFNDLEEHEENSSLKSILLWWEKRRLKFNLTVGFTGILALCCSALILFTASTVLDIQPRILEPPMAIFVLILAYGFMANVCYSLGWIVGIYYQLSHGSPPLSYRSAYIYGTLTSILITLILPILFSAISVAAAALRIIH